MNDEQIQREAEKIARYAEPALRAELTSAVIDFSTRVRDSQREEDAKKVCRYCRIEKYGKAHYDGEYWVHTGSEEYATAVYCQAAAIRQGEKG